MTTFDHSVLLHMNEQVEHWQATNDQRCIFLGCYAMMTGNMLDALSAGRFADNDWVARNRKIELDIE